MRNKRLLWLSPLLTALLVLAGLPALPAAAAGPDLASGRPATASSVTQTYHAGHVTDGNPASYWESANHAFPQWVRVDLGSAKSVNEVVLKLPPQTAWATRTQTLAVRGSTDGSTWSTLKPSAGHVFDPATGNTVTIGFTTDTARYVRLDITANTGWPAGQISEFEVYGPTTGDMSPPSAPGGLAYTEPAAGQIKLTWNASTDDVGVTGYDVYANNTLRASVGGNVLTYTDNQPAAATISYTVRAKDASGKESAPSNTVTRPGTGDPGSNLAIGKEIVESGHVHTFVAANANDDDVNTYWEGDSGAFPNTLTVKLGANASTTRVVVKLNPAGIWGTRTQNIQVLGREQSSSSYTSLVPARDYVFNPADGNSVTIPVTATVADVRLRFNSNTGAPGGQAAEFQVFGTPAPNPDLVVTAVSWTPASPVETDAVTLSATVKNEGTARSGATDVNLYLGDTKAGTAGVGELAAGASTTVSANIGPRDAGGYEVSARVDEGGAVIEQSETNNSRTAPGDLTVRPVDSADLVPLVTWTPGNPSAGSTATFSVAVKNQGNVASASGAHNLTVTVLDESGTAVRTLTGAYNGAIAAGATTTPVSLGTWTAADGEYTVRAVVAADANELPVKRANNTADRQLFIGRGANMPYDHLEAEDAVTGGGADVVGPNRTIGDLAGEASGRRAVTLNNTGEFVEFTTRASTNTLVTRFSIPDSANGTGRTSTLNVYVNGAFHKAITLTSRYTWVYGNEANPGNSPGPGPRHIYDEANMMLDGTFPAGTKIKLQKDAANDTTYAIDFIDTEQATPLANPDPAAYAVPSGFTHQAVQNALDQVRQSSTLEGVYLPAGTYETSQKFQVYGKPVNVVGAGPWFSRFQTPQNGQNTDAGFRTEPSANGSTFAGFGFFGNYTSRIDGPGKVFDFTGVENMTVDNVWVEHTVCMFWASNIDDSTIRNSRIRNTWADAINLTNGSSNNTLTNLEARSTGDDSFALFPAIDIVNEQQVGNVYENLTSMNTWRAAGLAVYGGAGNTFRNIYIADTLTYPAVTIGTLQFGSIPAKGFESEPKTTFENISMVRSGGHFWGQQAFPALWLFSGEFPFRGIRINDVDIIDPTYQGIMFQTKYVGGQATSPITDTILTNVTISGARRSGDAFNAKSGIGIWANELPEPGQGPAVGSATFDNLTLTGNAEDIRNTTTTFDIIRNP